jgi:hypothetical protein
VVEWGRMILVVLVRLIKVLQVMLKLFFEDKGIIYVLVKLKLADLEMGKAVALVKMIVYVPEILIRTLWENLKASAQVMWKVVLRVKKIKFSQGMMKVSFLVMQIICEAEMLIIDVLEHLK